MSHPFDPILHLSDALNVVLTVTVGSDERSFSKLKLINFIYEQA